MSEQHPLAHYSAARRGPDASGTREKNDKSTTAAQAVRARVLAGERDRVAAQLNSLVITRAFRVGLQLAALIDAHPELAADLYPMIDETDALIREVRHIAFDVRRAS